MPRIAGISLIGGAMLFALVLFVGSCSKSPTATADDRPEMAGISLFGLTPVDSFPRWIEVTFDRSIRVKGLVMTVQPDLGGTAGVTGSDLRYVPRIPFSYGVGYTAHVSGEFIGSNGQSVVIDTTWTFTLKSRDQMPPALVSVFPSGVLFDQEPPGHVEIVFSELVDGAGLALASVPQVNGSLEIRDSIVTFTPDAPFVLETEYMFTLSGFVIDTGGNRAPIDFSWSFSAPSDKIVYVAPGRSGDGSRTNPFGLIQTALDEVRRNPLRTTVYVAVGEYREGLAVDGGVTVSGGHDPANDWITDVFDSTVIVSAGVNGVAAGMALKSPAETVELRNLTIHAPSALDPGESSYGIIVDSCALVVLRGCAVSAGDAARGENGVDGVAGRNGDVWGLAPGGSGGIGGYEEGGYYDTTSFGWEYWVRGTLIPPQTGFSGTCAGDGSSGANGSSGVLQFDINNVAIPLSLSINRAGAGADGSHGCGGDGGTGGYVPGPGISSPSPSGGCGGRGGAGGEAGTGGTGGMYGGNSIGVLSYSSVLQIAASEIEVFNGEDGGSGGAGGVGGAGMAGGDPCRGFDICVDSSVFYCGDLNNGAPGQDGLSGGDGGHGGGAAGGSSIGVLSVGSTVTVGNGVVFKLGSAGKGGVSAGNPGQDGVVRDVYVVQ